MFELSLGNYFEKLNEISPDTPFLEGHKIILNEDFFSNDFSKNNTIFLLGSSHIGHLNVTEINNFISVNMTDSQKSPIIVYNLARAGNNPLQEIKELHQIISSKPVMIFYGISYWEFEFSYVNEKSDILPDPELVISDMLHSGFDDYVPSNPQWLTRTIFTEITKLTQEKKPYEFLTWVMIPKTPFYPYALNTTIMSNDELEKQPL